MRVDTAAWPQVLWLGMGAPQCGQFSEAMLSSVLGLADKRDSAPTRVDCQRGLTDRQPKAEEGTQPTVLRVFLCRLTFDMRGD